MAWTQQLPSGLYRGCYRDTGGRKQYTKPYRHQPTALRAAASAEDDARRTGRDPRADRMLWGAWADQWLPTRRVEASTAAANSSHLKQVRERWDDVPVGDIKPTELRRWVLKLEKVYAASTVQKIFYLLSASLEAARLEGMLLVNPCRGVALPPLPPAEERYLTDAEQSKVLFRLNGVYRILGEVLAGTGMRISEACGLHWHRVHLDLGTVDVIETWDLEAGQMKAYPKGKRRRTVPLTPDLVAVLVAWQDAHPDTGSCGRPHARYQAATRRAIARGIDPVDRCRSGLVLPGPRRGGPINPREFTKHPWKRAVEAAEVADATPHALRHSYASRLVTAGLPLQLVQGLLGHRSIVTTERYAHRQTDGHDDVRAALSGSSREAGREADQGVTVSREGSPWSRPRAV